jgi:hypothetical protein
MANDEKIEPLYAKIPASLKYRLEDLATSLSRQHGRRVTATEIVIEALEARLASVEQGQSTPDSDNVLLQPPSSVSQTNTPVPDQHGPELDEGVPQEGQLDKRYPEYGGQRSQGEHDQG